MYKIDQDTPTYWDLNYAAGFYQDNIIGDHIFWKRFLDEFFQGDRKYNILELGCGVGMATDFLKREGHNAFGIDYSKVAIKEAIRRYGDLYICDDIRTYKHYLDADYIVCFEVIEHFKDPRIVLRNIAKNLRQGGSLIFSVPRKGGKFADIDQHHTIFDYEKIIDMFSYFFDKIEFYNLDPLTKKDNIYGVARRK